MSKADSLYIVREQEGEWTQLAPGASCKLLYQASADLVTMLLRLNPDAQCESTLLSDVREAVLLDGAISTDGKSAQIGVDLALGSKQVLLCAGNKGADLLIRAKPPSPARG